MANDASEREIPDAGGSIDTNTFAQILEMDDDDDREFSKSIVWGFFDQASGTIEDMDDGIENRDLEALSKLGHFLKGSSATLGLTHIKASCEKIQHWGHGLDETGSSEEERDNCLNYIKHEIPKLRREVEKVKGAFTEFYED